MDRPLDAWTVTETSPLSGKRVKRLFWRVSLGWERKEEMLATRQEEQDKLAHQELRY